MHAGVKAGVHAGLHARMHAEMHGRVKEEMHGEIHGRMHAEMQTEMYARMTPTEIRGVGAAKNQPPPTALRCSRGATRRPERDPRRSPPPATAQSPRRAAQQRPLQAAAGDCGTTAPRGQCGGRRQRACALRPPAPSLELRAASPGPSCRCSRAFPSTASRGGGNPPRCKLPCKVCNCTAPRCKESCCSESGKLQLHED